MRRRTVCLSDQRTIEEPLVNLTPLIDVVFVILITFIVIAPLLEIDRVELAEARWKSQDQTISAQETSQITLHVREDNSIWLNGQQVSPKQLPESLKQAKKRYPGARPQVFHDQMANFGTYQTVKNAAETAGFEQIDIILKPS